MGLWLRPEAGTRPNNRQRIGFCDACAYGLQLIGPNNCGIQYFKGGAGTPAIFPPRPPAGPASRYFPGGARRGAFFVQGQRDYVYVYIHGPAHEK